MSGEVGGDRAPAAEHMRRSAAAPRWSKVVIVGPGLLGASVGLGLRQRGLADRIVGVARRTSTLDAAVLRGAIDEGTHDVEGATVGASLVVICTPVEQIAEQARRCAAAAPADVVLTDVGSTKERLVGELAGLTRAFIGSHPLAGGDQTGPEHADADLFVGRKVVVTPFPNQCVAQQGAPTPLSLVIAFWESLGARVLTMDAALHDRLLAHSSHLPHIAAAAVAAATPDEALPLTATGWGDTTRVAKGDVELWRQILLDNRAHVLRSLDKLVQVLADYREAIDRADGARLVELLEAGKRNRDAVGN